ncbi:MAG: serine/threonine protein kinase [Steroidobacteraceae bacterium]
MPPASSHPYDRLTPEVLLSSVESVGLIPDGRILALNSYENRVYQLGMEEGPPLIAKFYRPERWSDAAILEEHAFALELAAAEIPVVPPLFRGARTLFEHEDFRFAIFERRGGRWPELQSQADREWMGRFMGRMHMIGARSAFRHRGRLSVDQLGVQSAAFLLEQGWIPEHLEAAYDTLTQDILERVSVQFESAQPLRLLRLHGDCHPGNVLWTDTGPHFVDLDDCISGPAMQDLWMLLSGSRTEMGVQLSMLLDGYTQFAEFNYSELGLIEALRSLRIIHYSGWLARRWEDPAFPRAFPWFAEPRYWENHVLALREQLAALDEGPLELGDR